MHARFINICIVSGDSEMESDMKSVIAELRK